jgi:hypothetical protein
MSQQVYRGNLSAKVFPFVSEFFGRSIIVAGQDQNFNRQVTSTEDTDKDKGIPQLYYCHNVMPMAAGFQSVGYTSPVGGFPNETQFQNTFVLRDDAGIEVFFSVTVDGRCFALPFGNPSWLQITNLDSQQVRGRQVTTAFVNGKSYVYFAGVGCYKYNSITNLMEYVTLAGLTPSLVQGIVAASGYMIAWTKTNIAWSSVTDPTDFVPSLTTGAGGGGVEAAKGPITGCISHQMGFMVYTIENCVAASYSGNSRYPFNYKEIVASGGLGSLDYIAYDAESGNHYAYTTSGLQLVSMSATQTVLPDVTDFISGKYFEDFDENTNAFVRTTITGAMKKAINVVADRYLVISYGVNSLTHALVYDITNKRFGKLKIPHVSCFEWKLLTPTVIETPRESLAFLQADGTIKIVDFSYTSPTANGVMLLGKFQYVRSRQMQLQEVELDNIRSGANFSLSNYASLDGKTLANPTPGFLNTSSDGYRSYYFHKTGVNHTLLFKGAFFCTSIVLTFNIHGRR